MTCLAAPLDYTFWQTATEGKPWIMVELFHFVGAAQVLEIKFHPTAERTV